MNKPTGKNFDEHGDYNIPDADLDDSRAICQLQSFILERYGIRADIKFNAWQKGYTRLLITNRQDHSNKTIMVINPHSGEFLYSKSYMDNWMKLKNDIGNDYSGDHTESHKIFDHFMTQYDALLDTTRTIYDAQYCRPRYSEACWNRILHKIVKKGYRDMSKYGIIEETDETKGDDIDSPDINI